MKLKTKMIAVAVAITVSAPAIASGGGGGGGGFSGGGGFDRAPKPVKLTPEQRSFQNGQKAYKKSIACKKCAYPRGITSTSTAKNVVTKIKSGEIKVKENKKKDLLYYLSQRYRVSS